MGWQRRSAESTSLADHRNKYNQPPAAGRNGRVCPIGARDPKGNQLRLVSDLRGRGDGAADRRLDRRPRAQARPAAGDPHDRHRHPALVPDPAALVVHAAGSSDRSRPAMRGRAGEAPFVGCGSFGDGCHRAVRFDCRMRC